jgi:glucose-6-phosphate 1-epimerase
MTISTLDLSDGPAGIIHLHNRHGDSATVSLFGAQLLSWKTVDGSERFYCTPMSLVKPGAPIRGGVPVCFPQFSNRGSLPKHGLARTTVWQIDRHPNAVISGADHDVASARLTLSDSNATRALWPHHFLLQLQIELGAGWISVALNVTNTGSAPFDFTAALHTYLATADVRHAGVAGLQSVSYLDTANNVNGAQSEAILSISNETDRIYLSPPAVLQLRQEGQPALRVEQQGFTDSVIWNPGPDKAMQLGDMPAEDWSTMLCIEAAQIEHPVRLSPQAIWRGVQRLALI